MESHTSKVTTKGQIVIPKKIREKYGIGPSTAIRWIEKSEGILMVPDQQDPVETAKGMFAGAELLQSYMEEKKAEKEREEKKIARS